MTQQRGMKILTVLIGMAMGLTAFHLLEDRPVHVSFVDEVNSVKDSCILVTSDDGGWGSGAVVGPNEVMTAGHVAMNKNLSVMTIDGRKHKVLKVRYSLGAKPDPNMLFLGMKHPQTAYDVAVLVVDPNGPLPTPVQFSREPVRQGEEVYTIGAPAIRGLAFSVLTGRVVKVDVNCEYVPFWKSEGLVACNYDTQGGSSGGPVFRGGKVVGVHVASMYRYGAFIPITYAEDLL